MIWLFGDSIFYGSAIGSPSERQAGRADTAHPLWPLRGPAETMNLILGEARAAFGGPTGQPSRTGLRGGELRAMVTRGEIGPDDTLFMLDVGDHTCDPDLFERQWLDLRRAATDQVPLRLFMCTGFDNLTAPGKRAFMHDLPFGDRSHNDAVRAAATAELDTPGRTHLVEIGPAIGELHAALTAAGPGAYLRDNIHLNIWGQTGLAILLIRTALPGAKPDLAPVRALTAAEPFAAPAMAVLEGMAASGGAGPG